MNRPDGPHALGVVALLSTREDRRLGWLLAGQALQRLLSVWGVPVRSSEIAVTVTGIMIAGAAYLWREILGFFSGLSRKFTTRPRPWR